MKKISIGILIAVLAAAVGAAGFYLHLLKYAKQPADPNGAEIVMEIKAGEGFKSIAQRLQTAGVIRGSFKFSLLARLKGIDKRIKAGEYLFSAGFSPAKILEMMVSGKVILHKMTVPEGLTLQQIAGLAAESGLVKAKDFLAAARDAERVRTEGIAADTFEGYLFPDTYYFPRGTTAVQMVETMVRRFRSVFTPAWEKRARELGFSVHQIVTLASIIEKETGLPAERPLISAVFHNRLKKGMRLESDPTVIYGVKDFDGNITRKQLAADTAYNTYRIRGLPPGPIANPGERSLEAALYPADSPYLYFVSKNDNSHAFSTNAADHYRAVRKYQLHK